MALKCDYCGGNVELITGAVLYPHRVDLSDKQFYRCQPCAAWVGCHPGTKVPLGRLAKADLRTAKSKVHSLLDPLWSEGSCSRHEAYRLLAEGLSLSTERCHIGMFDLYTCDRAIRFLKAVTPIKALK